MPGREWRGYNIFFMSHSIYSTHKHTHGHNRASLNYLLRNTTRCLLGVVTLVDDITNLLAVHDEVDAVCGEGEEGVVDMMQLERNEQHDVSEHDKTRLQRV